jgi:hypothetical protein
VRFDFFEAEKTKRSASKATLPHPRGPCALRKSSKIIYLCCRILKGVQPDQRCHAANAWLHPRARTRKMPAVMVWRRAIVQCTRSAISCPCAKGRARARPPLGDIRPADVLLDFQGKRLNLTLGQIPGTSCAVFGGDAADSRQDRHIFLLAFGRYVSLTRAIGPRTLDRPRFRFSYRRDCQDDKFAAFHGVDYRSILMFNQTK